MRPCSGGCLSDGKDCCRWFRNCQASFIGLDVLAVAGHDARSLPLSDRRALAPRLGSGADNNAIESRTVTGTLPGTWREPHRDVHIPRQEAVEAWVAAAVPVLEIVASTYGDYITYKKLADAVSQASGVHTKQQLNHWMGEVLGGVIQACSDRGLPELSSLVVHTGDGMVGSGFNEVLRRSGRDPIDDPYELEMAAAVERLACYKVYCTELPEDAEPQLTREYSAQVKRATRPAPRPRPVCQGCGLQLPATGICDNC